MAHVTRLYAVYLVKTALRYSSVTTSMVKMP